MAASTKLPRAIVDLDEFTESKNIMVYADSGAGKTGLVGRLPGKVLILSSENGTVVIKRMAKRFGWDEAGIAKRFKVWAIRSWQDMEDAYVWVKDNPDVFDWIAIDSITSIQQRAMRAAMEIAVKRSPEKRDIDLPDRGEHQKMQNAVKRMVVDFNELPVNVFWTAQAMNREDKDGNDIVLPFVMGKDYEVSAFVCAQMHAYGYLKKRPWANGPKAKAGKAGLTERIMIWDSYADSEGVYFWAKDRYMVMPTISVISQGDTQITSFTDLLALIDGDQDAMANAVEAVESYDAETDAEPEPESDEDDADEVEDDILVERRAELTKLTVAALKKVVAGIADLDPASLKGLDKAGVVEAILDFEFGEIEPEDEPDEPEEDEPDEEDIEPEDDTEEPDNEERRKELLLMTPANLKKVALALEMETTALRGKSKAEVVDAILIAEAEALEAEAEADAESDEDEDEDDGNGERREELSAFGKADLRAAVEAAGLTVMSLKGKGKAEVIEAIIEAENDQVAGEAEDDEMDGFADDEPEPEPVAKKAPTKKTAAPRFRAATTDK